LPSCNPTSCYANIHGQSSCLSWLIRSEVVFNGSRRRHTISAILSTRFQPNSTFDLSLSTGLVSKLDVNHWNRLKTSSSRFRTRSETRPSMLCGTFQLFLCTYLFLQLSVQRLKVGRCLVSLINVQSGLFSPFCQQFNSLGKVTRYLESKKIQQTRHSKSDLSGNTSHLEHVGNAFLVLPPCPHARHCVSPCQVRAELIFNLERMHTT
jgi:hypothetical protein